jgi:GAF domain-containing protein
MLELIKPGTKIDFVGMRYKAFAFSGILTGICILSILIFGQPRMALLPALGDARHEAGDMETNAITMRALVEIYPTPSQLPSYVLTNRITGHVAKTGEPLLVHDAAHHEFGERIAGTVEIEESLLAVPLKFGTRVIGVIVISKLGLDQFDADDLRLLEVLAGHASVALENARLYEAQRREGAAFSLRDFHDHVLAQGQLPLPSFRRVFGTA